MYQRDPAEGDSALAIVPAEGYRVWFGSILPREWFQGYATRLFHRPDAAPAFFLAARARVEKHLGEHSDDGMTWGLLGRIDAMLGERDKAIAAADQACQLWPLSREPIRALKPLRDRVVTYAWVGEKERALKDLAAHITEPAFLTYGELKLDPDWDPLRGDPRFEKLVASLAPK